MTGHATADELALLTEGELRRRKAAKVAAHVAGCARCTRVRTELAEVSVLLAATPYPSLPRSTSLRIEAAMRVEVSRRLAAVPATGSGKRDLPSWHLPGLSVVATRLVTAAGVLALVGGGSYLLASNLSSGVASSSSSAAALPPAGQPMTAGPNVTYASQGSQHTIHSVSSATNFVPAQLRAQALDAYHEAQLKGEAGAQSSAGISAPNTSPLHSSEASPLETSAPGGGSQLAGCIQAVADGRSVALLDLARYEGKPATIIVLGSTSTSQAEVIVTADSCSATSPNVLARAPLGHL
jgi:hypothetical protein